MCTYLYDIIIIVQPNSLFQVEPGEMMSASYLSSGLWKNKTHGNKGESLPRCLITKYVVLILSSLQTKSDDSSSARQDVKFSATKSSVESIFQQRQGGFPKLLLRLVMRHLEILPVSQRPSLVLELHDLLPRIEVDDIPKAQSPGRFGLLPRVAAVEGEESGVRPDQSPVRQAAVDPPEIVRVYAKVHPPHRPSVRFAVRRVLDEDEVYSGAYRHGRTSSDRRGGNGAPEHLVVEPPDRSRCSRGASELDVSQSRTSPHGHAMGGVLPPLGVRPDHLHGAFRGRQRRQLYESGLATVATVVDRGVQVESVAPGARHGQALPLGIVPDREARPGEGLGRGGGPGPDRVEIGNGEAYGAVHDLGRIAALGQVELLLTEVDVEAPSPIAAEPE